MSEIWKPVPGFEGRYEVSDHGNVYRVRRERVRGGLAKQHITRGYYYVYLEGQSFRVHRLVLRAFVGEPQPGQVGCHNNGDPLDNRLENLRWDSVPANIADAMRHGTWNSERRLAHLQKMNEARHDRAR
jgi:hypothetical protein